MSPLQMWRCPRLLTATMRNIPKLARQIGRYHPATGSEWAVQIFSILNLVTVAFHYFVEGSSSKTVPAWRRR